MQPENNYYRNMKTQKLSYETPLTEQIIFRPECNFCTSSQDVTMPGTIIDEMDALDFIW